MKATLIIAITLMSLGILSACGQSGPLYVPGDPSSVQRPQPVPEAEDEGEENGEEEQG